LYNCTAEGVSFNSDRITKILQIRKPLFRTANRDKPGNSSSSPHNHYFFALLGAIQERAHLGFCFIKIYFHVDYPPVIRTLTIAQKKDKDESRASPPATSIIQEFQAEIIEFVFTYSGGGMI
jgi:hypothetical protein